MPTEIVTALIAGVVTLITSIGTWHFSAKKDRDKTREDLLKQLNEYYQKNRDAINDIRQNDLRDIRDDVTNMGANLQQKIAILESEFGHVRNDIVTLSNRVEKHNGVIERVYHCEDMDKLLDEKISVANHRIADAEDAIRKLTEK